MNCCARTAGLPWCSCWRLLVLASLAASLFGAPYKLQLTPADFSNDYPQIAAVNEDGTALQIWNNSEDFVPPGGKK